MPVDEVLWAVLGERLATGDGDRRGPPPSWDESSRDAAIRVLDAGIAAMAATAHFATVAEELLRDRRDRLAPGPPTEHGEPEAGAPPRPAGRIDLTY
jgi:hypothetical protein